MKSPTIFVVIFGILFISGRDAGPVNSSPSQDDHSTPGLRIVSGYQTELLSVAPHQVSLRLKDINWHLCGGSIISSFWILTAGHCTSDFTASELVAVVGTLRLDAGGDYYDIAKVFTHEHYVYEIVSNDIALLKVQREFSKNKPYFPIALCDSDTPVDVPMRITGWGVTKLDGNMSNHLLSMDTKSISTEQCVMELYDNELLPPVSLTNNICVVNGRGQGACEGDSGGGLIDLQKNQVCGVVSWGVPCAQDKPDVYTKVYYYRGWIRNIMANN